MAKNKVDLGLWRVCVAGKTNHYFKPDEFSRCFIYGRCDQAEAVIESIRLGKTFKLEDGRECKRTELIVREKVDELGAIMDRYAIKESDVVAITATRNQIRFHIEPEAFHRMQDSFADDFETVETENHSPDEYGQLLHHRGVIDGVEFIAIEHVKESKDGFANQV